VSSDGIEIKQDENRKNPCQTVSPVAKGAKGLSVVNAAARQIRANTDRNTATTARGAFAAFTSTIRPAIVRQAVAG
jgi:hypothetical protein